MPLVVRFGARYSTAQPRRLPLVPPGMPIGGAAGDWLGD